MGQQQSAPTRKPSAPRAVAPFAIAALTGSFVEGWISEASSAAPNAIEPSRFTKLTHHPREWSLKASQPREPFAKASALAT